MTVTDIQKEFRDIHKDKMAFLIGAGVSLDSVDENLLKPYVTMVINEAILKIDNPDYYFSCDGGSFIYDIVDCIAKEAETKVIVIDSYAPESEEEEIRGRNKKYYYSFDRKDREDYTVNKDDSKLLFGMSSAHTAAHLLHIMGCDPIILIGCECRYTEDRYAFWSLPKYKDKVPDAFKRQTVNNDFNNEKNEYNKYTTREHLNGFSTYWAAMKRLNPELPIIDACNSVMSCFPKMSLEEVLQKYKGKEK